MTTSRLLTRTTLLALLLHCCTSLMGFAQELQAPANVVVTDRPNDAGTGLIIKWDAPPQEAVTTPAVLVTGYRIWREVDGQRDEQPVAKVDRGEGKYVDPNCKPSLNYRYFIQTIGPTDDVVSVEVASEPAKPVVQWFDRSRIWIGLIIGFICLAVVVCTEMAKRGWSTYVRPIAGLAAIDEAVGRATEMGRPMLFVPGIQDLDQIDTVAGLTVMAHVGMKAAEYDTPMEVPTARSLVMTAAREALAGSYLAAGRPESFNEDRVYYVTDDQFSYVASVCGWMSREKPAACFFLGKFYAESLLLAETGNAVGAIQLAGTAETPQLPFFVAACDYTLIGEELFAASAYLSGEPQQLGTLKGQDVGKLFVAVLLVGGCLLATVLQFSPGNETLLRAQGYLMTEILGEGASE